MISTHIESYIDTTLLWLIQTAIAVDLGNNIVIEIIKPIIACVIWTTYMSTSKRVKNTFVNPGRVN